MQSEQTEALFLSDKNEIIAHSAIIIIFTNF